MQRILPRGEIENLDHTLIPRVRLPEGADVFHERAARLRQLAVDSPLADYLRLMAHVADAQAHSFPLQVAGPSPERLSHAQAHNMPPLQALGWTREPIWQQVFFDLLAHVQDVVPSDSPTVDVCATLSAHFQQNPDQLEAMADALLARLDSQVDAAAVPFLMAALQVYFTSLSCRFQLQDLPINSPFGVCPLCGSLPVASVVRVGKQIEGCRYLYCSLCSTEWHLVRVVCSHCEDTEAISFHAIENGLEGIKAESCAKCGVYRKIFYQEKQPLVDAIADDLATIRLDLLMGQEGYYRASENPLLWQEPQESS